VSDSPSLSNGKVPTLPHGWLWVKMGDLQPDFQNGLASRGEPDGSPTVVLRLADISNGSISLRSARSLPVSKVSRSKYSTANADILIIRVNGSIDIVGRFIPCDMDGLVYCDHFIRMRILPEVIASRFLVLVGSSPRVRSQIERLFVSTAGQNTVNQRHISSILLPLPPRAEQDRIVAAIEEQFSRLDAGVAALQRARQTLKKLRDLLPLLLLGGDGSAPEPSGLDSGYANRSSYPWAQLAEVSEQVVDCPHSTPKFLSQGMPCIDTTCISAGVIHRDRLRYVDPVTYQDRVRRLVPQYGDMIFAREGTVGTAVVVPEDLHPCLGQRVMLFRPDLQKVNSDYLCLVVNSEIVKRQYRPRLLGTTVAHLNVRDAKALRIPLPPLRVQETIATKADRVLSILDAFESALELNLMRSSSLRSSILAAAFSGKLVPQDPTEESASALLGRIAAERTSSNQKKPTRARKPRGARVEVTA